MSVVHVSENSSLFSLTRILPTLEIFRLHSRDRLNLKLPPCQHRDSYYRKYRLVFIMGIAIPRKTVFVWRPGPGVIHLKIKRGSCYIQVETSWLTLFKNILSCDFDQTKTAFPFNLNRHQEWSPPQRNGTHHTSSRFLHLALLSSRSQTQRGSWGTESAMMTFTQTLFMSLRRLSISATPSWLNTFVKDALLSAGVRPSKIMPYTHIPSGKRIFVYHRPSGLCIFFTNHDWMSVEIWFRA